jgi:hydrogenase nickel incorporation protein HypA/HybF
MHELSIAENLIEIASNAAQAAGVQHVQAVHLRLGALSGVVADALQFSYEVAAAGTLLEGSQLVIQAVPAAIYCAVCAQVVELPTIQAFCCPVCGTFSTDVRQGRELEIISLEVEDEQPTYS